MRKGEGSSSRGSRRSSSKGGKGSSVLRALPPGERHESGQWEGWGGAVVQAVPHHRNTAWLGPGHARGLRVASWNVLAEEYCYHHFYKHLGADAGRVLDWKTRAKMIVDHLIAVEADVLCLQEVQQWGMMQTVLAGHGYDGCYKQRTGHKLDGCAIFWKREKFAPVGEPVALEFNKSMGKEGEHRVALRVVLAHKESGKMMTVCTLHLDYKRPRAQVQMGRLLAAWVREALKEQRGATVVCGDWNCELAHEAVQGFLDEFNGQMRPVLPQKTPNGSFIGTTYMREHKHIDHMFYHSKYQELVAVKVPSLSMAPLPHADYPSDHELVGGMLVFKEDS